MLMIPIFVSAILEWDTFETSVQQQKLNITLVVIEGEIS